MQKAKEHNHPWAAVWELACYTSLRAGELYALTHDSFDLEGERIFVKRSWSKVSGMNEYPKNKQDRVVPIAPALDPLLRDLKEAFCTSMLSKGVPAVQVMSIGDTNSKRFNWLKMNLTN